MLISLKKKKSYYCSNMYYLQTLSHYGVAPEVNSGSSPAQPLGVGAAEELFVQQPSQGPQGGGAGLQAQPDMTACDLGRGQGIRHSNTKI